MEEFGCFYNPRPSPGRCIKDNISTNVEKQCEIANNGCKLKSDSKLPPITKSVLPPISTVPVVDIKKPNNMKKDKLSGPISAYVTNMKNRSFNFYGDAHFSMENNCSPCKDINLRDLTVSLPPGSENCWDISVLLAETFTQASNEGKWVDFYLEVPFIGSNTYNPTRKDTLSNVQDYITKLYYIFYNCFNKLNCEYNTTRFHYVDVRLQYKKLKLPEFVSELEKLIMMENNATYTNELINYEMNVSLERVEKSLRKFGDMIAMKKRKRNQYIETTDKLMRDLYFSGGQTMSGKIDPKNVRLFKLYLTSDNFAEEATELMKESLTIANDPTLNLALVTPTMIVNRRGKNMHRVRAQLEALEIEGQQELAKKIVDFTLNKYINNNRTNQIIDLWRGIMIAYDGFINSKYRSANDTLMLFNKFMNEMDKNMKLTYFSVSGIALIMDAYLLGRMFRTFPGKNHIDSVKKIVYAGAFHILTYVQFFEYLGNNFIKYDTNKTNNIFDFDQKVTRCLNVDIDHFKL